MFDHDGANIGLELFFLKKTTHRAGWIVFIVLAFFF